MKKAVLFLLFITLAIASYGQDVVQAQPTQSCIVRKGDCYTVDGVTYNNSTAFRGYLKNTNPDLFAQYNKGYQLGMAGWGLLAYGTAMMPTSFILSLFHHDTPDVDPITGKEDYHHKEDARWSKGWWSSFAIAAAALAVSIPILGVGYQKMHKSVDDYNVSHRAAPQTYWSIQVSGNGIGVAYNF